MAKKKVSGVGAIDRQIASTRKRIAAIRKAATAKKSAARKARKLAVLKNQLKRMSKRK